MKRTFTRVLTLSCFIGAMMGCAKNDPLSTANNSEVSFSTHVDGTTKGTTKIKFKIGDQFGLMATESATDWSNADANWYMGGGVDAPTVITNTPLSNGAGAWKYSPIKLWPETNKVSFFAYSPISDGVNGISNVQATAGSPTLDFAVSDDVKAQIDLLRAEALNKYAEEVQLAFSHALTRVTFAAKANVTANQRVRLDKIELKGIKNSGTLKLYDDARVVGALDDMGGWSAQAGAADYDLALTHEVASLVPSTLVPMTEDDQALFMIPQEFTGGSVLAVTYSYSNDNGKKWVNGSKFDIDLKEYTQYWNPSKNYRYVLTLSPENMYSFNADIVPWDTEIDLNVKDVLSISTLEVDPTGGKPHEVIVTETRGEALGYTLKSSDATWITISDAEAGTYAGEIAYAADGTITTKAYEMEKKWYIKVEPNTTGANREGEVTLSRENLPDVITKVAQIGVDPFKSCVIADLNGGAGVIKVDDLDVPLYRTKTYTMKASAAWFKLSTDGQGAGSKEITVTPKAGGQPFYIHPTLNVAADREAEIHFFIDGVQTNTKAIKQLVHPTISLTIPSMQPYYAAGPVSITGLELFTGVEYVIESNQSWGLLSLDGVGEGVKTLTVTPAADGVQTLYLHPYTNRSSSRSVTVTVKAGGRSLGSKSGSQLGNSDRYIGNFAGEIKEEVFGSEVLYYYDKELFAVSADAGGTYKWINTASTIGVTDKWDGKGNTAALVALSNAPAAKVCYDRSSVPANEYYLPAQNQAMSLWITKLELGTFGSGYFWSSTDNNNTSAWFVDMNYGLTSSSGNTSAYQVRCVREDVTISTAYPRVRKTGDGKVYIEVQGMPGNAWSLGSLNSSHNEANTTYNKLYYMFEVEKTNRTWASQVTPGCASGWRLATQRELMLMWIMKDALVKAGMSEFPGSSLWSSTLNSANADTGWNLGSGSGAMGTAGKWNTYLTRCVREV